MPTSPIISQNKVLNLLIKTVILGLLLYTLYRQIMTGDHRDALTEIFWQQFRRGNQFWIIAAIVLMPVNWLLESRKWQILMQPLAPVSLREAVRAILAGVTISMFTPNRIGEYGGRLLAVDVRHNWPTVLASLVGSFAQLLVLLGGGVIGAYFCLQNLLNPEPYLLLSSFLLGGSFVSILSLVYFNVDLIIPILRRIPLGKWSRPVLKQLLALRHYHRPLLLQALLLAFLRYAVYSGQYYLILRFFGLNAPILAAFSGIATIFLIQTSIPLPPLMGLLARGEIALFIWSHYSDHSLGILTATFLLFIINLSVPALLGAGIIVKTNVLKSLGYEKNSS